MANNTTLNAGSGGDTIRDIDKAGVKTPVVTIDLGGSGAESLIAGAMPCSQSGAWTVTVAQATAASLNATVVGTGTFVVQAQQSGTWNARAQDGSGNALTSLLVGSQRSLTVAIVDASGNQVTSFGGAGGTASNYGSAFPATGTAGGYSDGTNMQGARVFDLDSGAGTQYCLGVGIRLSGNGGSVEGGTASNPIRVDPTGTTTQPVSGSVSIGGTVSTSATQSGAWTVGISAGTSLIGQVAAAQQVAALYNGTTAVTPQYATLTTSSSGAQTLVAAQVGKKIYVLRWSVSANGATSVNLQSHTTTTLSTRTEYMAQYKDGGSAYCPAGVMATAAGEALDVVNGSAVSISVDVTYVVF